MIALSVENKKGGWEMSTDPADPLSYACFTYRSVVTHPGGPVDSFWQNGSPPPCSGVSSQTAVMVVVGSESSWNIYLTSITLESILPWRAKLQASEALNFPIAIDFRDMKTREELKLHPNSPLLS